MITAAMLLAPVKDEPEVAFIARNIFSDANVPKTKRQARKWLRESWPKIAHHYAIVTHA